MVTTLEGAPLREAQFFCEALADRDFHLGALVLNKVLPEFLRSAEARASADAILHDPGAVAAPLSRLGVADLADPEHTARVLRTVAASFRDYAIVASRELELREELGRVPEVVATVPALEDDVHDIGGLASIGERLLAP